jgi:uncharacterized membrane protein YoaK (UPF0700 family)
MDRPGQTQAVRPGESARHPLARILLLLTFSTGLVDGASYLGLGHVFTANMTGNVVLLGFGIAGSGGLPVVAPIVSLVAFVLGAAAAGRLAALTGASRRTQVLGALAAEALLALAGTVIALATTVHVGRFSGALVIALLALAMGARNAAVRRLAVPDLTTTVLTLTLTGLAADLGSGRGHLRDAVRRLSAVATMGVGAVIGALLLQVSLPLVLSGVVAFALAALIAWLVVEPLLDSAR